MGFKIRTQELQRQENRSKASMCNPKRRILANCQNFKHRGRVLAKAYKKKRGAKK